MDARRRFSPSNLNEMLEFLKEHYHCAGGSIAIESGLHGLVIPAHPYFKWEVEQHKFVVSHTAKDAENKMNEPNLPYVGELICNYLNSAYENDETLLVPLRLCRGYGKTTPGMWSIVPSLQRQHIVLLEVIPSQKKLIMHNSQTLGYTYPDKLPRLAAELGFVYEYNDYNTQCEHFTCGRFVWMYIVHALKTGSTANLKNIVFDEKSHDSKLEFIKESIRLFSDEEENDLDFFDLGASLKTVNRFS